MSRHLLFLLLLPLLLAPAHAATLPTIGQGASGVIELLGKPIPLPPGEWRVAAAGFGQATGQDPGPYGAIGGVLLLRQDSTMGEFLLLHTNLLPVRGGWGQPPECADQPTLFQSVGEPRNLHNACSFVVAQRRGQILRSHLPGLGNPEEAARITAALPPWALVSGFRVSDRRDMLEVRYGVAPRHPDPADWFVGTLPERHAHRVIVKQLGEWAQAARASALAALREPAEQVPAMPVLALRPSESSGEVAQEQISALRLGLYKLATYRLPSTASTFAVQLVAVGNVWFAAWITLWQGLTHSAVYLGNELAWEWPSATPMQSLVGTPVTAPPSAAATTPTATDEALVQIAANSATLPAGAIPLRNTYQVDGKQVPLPTGHWTLVGSIIDGGVTGTALGQIENATLQGLVVIHSNVEKTAGILGPSAECGRRDVLFAVTRYDTPEDGFCLYAKRVTPKPTAENPLWATVARKLAEGGVTVPAQFVMVGTRVRTQGNFVDARYYFAPANDDIAALQDWADLVQEPLELGVRGRLAADTPPLPLPWNASMVRAATAAQARVPVEELASAGVLSRAVLDRQLAAVDAAAAEKEMQRLSVWSRSFLKVATYRAAAYLDTVAVQTFFTGSPAQGVVIATVNAVYRPLLAYGNELYWARSGHGKAPAALLSANFPEIGSDR